MYSGVILQMKLSEKLLCEHSSAYTKMGQLSQRHFLELGFSDWWTDKAAWLTASCLPSACY